MSTTNRLKTSFEYVRTSYFPRWDKHQKWGIKRVWHLPAQGKCDRISKNILIKEISPEEGELHCILIHEICHASSSPYHGRRWQERMTKASERAEKTGHIKLSKLIDEEVKRYRQIPKNLNREAYDFIYDTVTAYPYIKFDKMVARVAKEYGMYPREFKRRFKRCRKIFWQAKEFMKPKRH
jgi:hypothetical protein